MFSTDLRFILTKIKLTLWHICGTLVLSIDDTEVPLHMYYYNPTVKQCLDRKGKPWRASIDYKDPITGKRKQKTKMLPGAKGKKEAKKMAEEWLAEMNDSVKTMAPVEQGKTLEEMIEGFENYRLTVGEIEKSTHQKNLAVSKNYIYPYLGNNLFSSIDRVDINAWLTKLFEKGLSPRTVRNAYTQLKKIYSYYYEVGDISKNPFNGVKAPKFGKPKVTHLTKEQMDDFLSAVYLEYEPTDPMYVGCLLAYYGGLRRGEICALRWRNIDFEKNTISVDSSIGLGQGGNYTKPPKTQSSIRSFPMVPQLYDALKVRYDYLAPKNSWFVIGNKDSFMSLQAFTKSFKDLADAYDLIDCYGKRITPHGLRHNLATVGIRSGMDIASLSSMMGHASRAMTLDVYGDANPDAMKTATEKLALRFNDDSNLAPDDDLADRLNAIEENLNRKT